MRDFVGLLFALAIGCGPARSESTPALRPAPAPTAKPAPAVGEPVDAGAQAAIDASAESESDGGVFGFAIVDAGPEASGLSPPLPVAFGVVDRQAQAGIFGAEIVLFKRRLSCREAAQPEHPDRVFSISAEWKAPHKNETTSFSVKDGVVMHYHAKLEVLSAPTRIGALGKVRLAAGPEYNVGGGEIPVLVCR